MSGLILLLSLSVLILVHEYGHFWVARRLGVKVERFSIGFGPVIFKWVKGQTEYVVSLLPLGGYVKMAGDNPAESSGAWWEYTSRPVSQRAGIVLAGPVVNYVTGALLFIGVFWAGYPALKPVIGELIEGYPAATSGLKTNDQVIAINGVEVHIWEELTQQLRTQTHGNPVELTVQRDKAVRTISVTPQIRAGKSILGKQTKVAVVGIAPSGEVILQKHTFSQAVVKGVTRTWELTVMTYQALWGIITGALPAKESLTGPVGIWVLTTSAAELGVRYLAQLLAIISVSLGIFNLLPIPVLDGGHLLFLAIERIRKKPVSLKIQEMTMQAGMVMLIGMMLFVTYQDLLKFKVVEKVVGFFR